MSKDLESFILLSIIVHLKKENIILNPIKVFTIELENINTLENIDIIETLSKLYDIPYYSYTYELDDIEDVLEDVIYYLETYNAETIRRSIPLYLLSMQIKEEDNNIKTIMSADLLDTLFFSSEYKDSKSRIELQKIIIDRLINIHRVDLCSSHNIAISNLLEFHAPFGSKDLIDYIMNIDPKYKLIYSGDSEKNIEKYILRKAFDGIISKDILWGCHNNDSFNKEVAEYFNKKILDIDFENEYDLYPIDMPKTKEEYIYRKIYESMQ